MSLLSAIPQLTLLADASAAASDMRAYIMPLFTTLVGLAGFVCAAFLVVGGYYYMTSSGKTERLEQGKKVIRNALIGLVIVLGAAALTALLSHSYSAPHHGTLQDLPSITEQKGALGDPSSDVITKAITGFLLGLVKGIGAPVIESLKYFTTATPMMADSASVFNLWLVVVGVADVLFILVIALIGFHVMTADTLGFEEIEFKHLLPQIALSFLLVNTSIFVIDAVISLSNAIIHAIQIGVDISSVWDALIKTVQDRAEWGVAALLIMIAFIVLGFMLLVYYVMRLVVLFLGAVLSPIVFLMWLLPSMRDFANTAIRAYLVTIFVLLVHVVILALAAALFSTMGATDLADSIIGMVLGIATVTLLLKTQGMLNQMALVSGSARSMRKMGGQFVHSVSHLSTKVKNAVSESRSKNNSSEEQKKGDKK